MGKKSSNINVFYLICSIIIWIIVSVWLVIILALSVENEYDSYLRSANLVIAIKNATGYIIDQTFLRKCAVGVEYAFLAMTLYLGFCYTNHVYPKVPYSNESHKSIIHENELFILYTFWITILASVVSEYMQFFADGREATIVDVGVAASAVCVELLIFRLLFVLSLRVQHKEEVDPPVETDA